MKTLFALVHYGQQKGAYKFGREVGQILVDVLPESDFEHIKTTHSYMYLTFNPHARVIKKDKVILVGVDNQQLPILEEHWRRRIVNIDIYRFDGSTWWEVPCWDTDYMPARFDQLAKIAAAFTIIDLETAQSTLSTTPRPLDISVENMIQLVRRVLTPDQIQQLIVRLGEKTS